MQRTDAHAVCEVDFFCTMHGVYFIVKCLSQYKCVYTDPKKNRPAKFSPYDPARVITAIGLVCAQREGRRITTTNTAFYKNAYVNKYKEEQCLSELRGSHGYA